MLTSQEKAYQKIESLFSSLVSPLSNSSLNMDEGDADETEEETGETEEYPSIIKNSIDIECQGKKYAYHLGEILRKKWNLWEVLHPSSVEKEEENPSQKGGSRLFFGGGSGKEENIEKQTVNPEVENNKIRLQFCLFTINTTAIVPFLEFWLVPNEQQILGFPEAEFIPSSDIHTDTVEEEEHAEFLDICRKQFLKMGIFQEGQEDIFTTKRMEQDYYGYIASPKEERLVYVFYQLSPPSGVLGTRAILDEMINQHRVMGQAVEPGLCSLFYSHPELLYIYGSPVNPIDSLFYGVNAEYRTSEEAAQEIPYCLYLCKDKREFSEEVEEGKAIETPVGKILGIEEEHYMSPKDKYQVEKRDMEKRGEGSLRSEDEYGYFYYFTNEPLGENGQSIQRYAVFVYNTDYRLDKSTMNTLKALNLEKRLIGGDYWKWNISITDWLNGGGISDFLQLRPRNSEDSSSAQGVVEDIPITKPEPEEQGAVEDISDKESEPEQEEPVYASIYFQRDDVPLWCIKHRICFTPFD
jgi:hypothetical protein